jgi:hypothetical protein
MKNITMRKQIATVMIAISGMWFSREAITTFSGTPKEETVAFPSELGDAEFPFDVMILSYFRLNAIVRAGNLYLLSDGKQLSEKKNRVNDIYLML